MNFYNLEEQVASAEERALHFSLIGHGRFEEGELAEAWQNLNRLEKQVEQVIGKSGSKLRKRLEAIRAELDTVERSLLGKGSLPPVAA